MLLSRRELDLLTPQDRAEFGRNMQYYHLNSERAQQLFSLTDLAFALVWSIIFLAGFFYFMSWGTDSAGDVRRTLTLYAMFLLGFPLVSLLYSTAILLVREPPYGLTLYGVFRLVVLSPFRPEIHDYQPSGDSSASR
jgi:hypothetical protein